jgi:hypothetical protein
MVKQIYAELANIKTIKPVDYTFNIIKWHLAMESKCISITNKVPGAYHKSQYIMDYLDASLTVKVKSFKAEVNILCNWYLHGNPDSWTASYITGKIIKTYNNMFEDGTWKREIGKKDQIMALTTKLTEMQAKFKQQVASFATQQAANNKENNQGFSSKSDGGSCHLKRQPYTVASWRLVKKEDKVHVNGKDYYWCTGDHYSGGKKHNGMYADHKSCDHDSWRKTIDDHCATCNLGKASNDTPAAATPAPEKKSTLNDKLCNAFCTQAGLSAEAVDCIWEDAQGNE